MKLEDVFRAHTRLVLPYQLHSVEMQLESRHAVAFLREQHGFSARSGAGVQKFAARLYYAADRRAAHRLKGVIAFLEALVPNEIFKDEQLREGRCDVLFGQIFFLAALEPHAHARAFCRRNRRRAFPVFLFQLPIGI